MDKDIDSYCIQRLNDHTQYMFRVMAQNPIGLSEALESEPIVIKTALGENYYYLLPMYLHTNSYKLNVGTRMLQKTMPVFV